MFPLRNKFPHVTISFSTLLTMSSNISIAIPLRALCRILVESSSILNDWFLLEDRIHAVHYEGSFPLLCISTKKKTKKIRQIREFLMSLLRYNNAKICPQIFTIYFNPKSHFHLLIYVKMQYHLWRHSQWRQRFGVYLPIIGYCMHAELHCRTKALF